MSQNLKMVSSGLSYVLYLLSQGPKAQQWITTVCRNKVPPPHSTEHIDEGTKVLVREPLRVSSFLKTVLFMGSSYSAHCLNTWSPWAYLLLGLLPASLGSPRVISASPQTSASTSTADLRIYGTSQTCPGDLTLKCWCLLDRYFYLDVPRGIVT